MSINSDALYSNLLADLSTVVDVQLPSWSIDSTPRQVAAYCLRDSFLKKYNEEDRPSESACLVALKKFQAVNERCRTWINASSTSIDEVLLSSVSRVIRRFWYVGGDSPLISDIREVFLNGRSGPGASLHARGFDLYTKMFDSPLSFTKDLAYLWRKCTSISGPFREAELHRSLSHGYTEVGSSRYSFVNKTRTVARGICTEPTINMWFQLGVGRMLERRLKTFFGIDLSTQPDRNRLLALSGSQFNNLVTIDLESASDSLSLGMLKEFLPRSFYGVLDMFRCERTSLPTGSELTLNMISTMGNGFTFPLQTMLFAAVVTGVANVSGFKLGPSNFGVFGDDIICPTGIYRRVLRVLHLLGFVVNVDKSFVEGPFRESCGADFFSGHNVRGVYLKTLLTKQDRYVAINLLNRWCAKTQLSLPSVMRSLISSFGGRFHSVPLDENDDAGVHTPFTRVRFRERKTNSRGTGLYGYWCSRPQDYCFYILGDHVWTFKEQNDRSYNPSGLLIAFVLGGIRGYRVSLRQRRVRYTTKRKNTPRWDFLPPRPLEGLIGSQVTKLFVEAWDRNFLSSGFWETHV